MAGSIVETRTARMIRTKGDNAYVNQYELLSILGEGMHGKVYLARDTSNNHRVVSVYLPLMADAVAYLSSLGNQEYEEN